MYWAEFFIIAIAHLFAVVSPGPDFAVVMRQSVRCGTRSGLWTSLGVGSAILLHVAYCLLGVALLLLQSPALFNIMKLLAASYLFYLGVQSIRGSLIQQVDEGEAAQEPVLSAARAFGLGFLTNGLNPKATLFFLALFTVVIDPNTPTSIQIMYGLYLAVATFLWFALLSLILGIPRVRVFILRIGVWLERAMGAIFILISLQIVLNGV
jgi:RhtB (resistance to homoserine/threonine) family protein